MIAISTESFWWWFQSGYLWIITKLHKDNISVFLGITKTVQSILNK